MMRADSSGLTNTRTILLPFQHTGSVTCSPASPGAAVCTPAAGATVPAPVHFTGAATPNPGYRISAIYALVDNVVIQKFLNVASFSLDLNLAPGPHSLRVQGWDTSARRGRLQQFIMEAGPEVSKSFPLTLAQREGYSRST